MQETPRRREVRGLLERREREGLTFKDLSKICGLSVSALSGWAYRLRREQSHPKVRMEAEAPGFVEIALPPTAEEARVEVVFPSGRRVLFPRGADPAWVGRILNVVDPC